MSSKDKRPTLREAMGMVDHPPAPDEVPLGYYPSHVDSGEGSMAQSQLEQICYMAEELKQVIESEDELPDWVQAKLATIKDRLQSVHGFLVFSDDPRVEDPAEHM